jgi:hypothetical protein
MTGLGEEVYAPTSDGVGEMVEAAARAAWECPETNKNPSEVSWDWLLKTSDHVVSCTPFTPDEIRAAEIEAAREEGALAFRALASDTLAKVAGVIREHGNDGCANVWSAASDLVAAIETKEPR